MILSGILGPLLAGSVWNSLLPSIPELQRALGPSSQIGSILRQLAGFGLGCFCIYFGLALILLKSWARTVGMAFHMIIGTCLLALTLIAFSRISSPGDPTNSISTAVATLVLITGVLVSAGLIAFGFQLTVPAAADAFFGTQPRLESVPKPKCPTCGSELDLMKRCCPKCDADDVQNSFVALRARLVGQNSDQEFPIWLNRETRVGRETAGYEIQLDDSSVSREHAKIEHVDGHFHLHALRDTNGTFVNGTRIRDSEIKSGDTIAFGRVQFRFLIE
jgi:hypothetical protein